MAIRRPGSRSNMSLLSSGALSVFLLIILIGGHIVIAALVLSSIFGDGGLKAMSIDTDIPAWALVLIVAGAVIMDIWIVTSMRRARKRRLER